MKRIAHEQKLVAQMIRLYCRAHHSPSGAELCSECTRLASYAHLRLNLCPWGEDKGFCAHCPTQCYTPENKEKIREVMRWAGYRMIWHEPQMVLAHLWETLMARMRRIERRPKQKIKQETKTNGRG